MGQDEEQSSGENTTLVGILGLAGMISAADNWIVSPMLPAIATGFGSSISQVGAVLTAYMIPYGMMQPIYGFISDRWGKVKILEWILYGLSVGTFACAFVTSLWMLCFWRAITGFFAAGVIAVSLALLGDRVPTLERQIHVGRFMGIVFLGQGLSVGLGGFFAKYSSWRVAFVAFALGAVSTIFFLRKIPQDFPSHVSRDFFAETKQVILSPIGKIIFPLALVSGFLLLGLYSFLGAFLHEVAGLDYLQVGIVVMFYGFACLGAGTQVGKLGKKIGEQQVIINGGLLAFAATVLLLFPYWQTGWIATVFLGVAYIFIQSTLATLAFDVASESKGLPSALIGFGLFGGGGLGTAVCSLLLSQYGYQILWITLSVGMLLYLCIVRKLYFTCR